MGLSCFPQRTDFYLIEQIPGVRAGVARDIEPGVLDASQLGRLAKLCQSNEQLNLTFAW